MCSPGIAALRRHRLCPGELEPIAADVQADGIAFGELTVEDAPGQRVLYVLLDETLEGPGISLHASRPSRSAPVANRDRGSAIRVGMSFLTK